MRNLLKKWEITIITSLVLFDLFNVLHICKRFPFYAQSMSEVYDEMTI